MKYEMIFGDEKLFDETENESFLVAVRADVSGKAITFFYTSLVEAFNYGVNFPPRGIVFHSAAMRRIIKEPKHWTAEDQKAGRLPEVGAEFQTSIGKRKCVITEGKFIFTVNDDAVEVFTIDSAMPLESPREKYERERDEFIDKVCIFVDVCTVSESIKQAHRHGAVKVYEQLKPFKEETK